MNCKATTGLESEWGTKVQAYGNLYGSKWTETSQLAVITESMSSESAHAYAENSEQSPGADMLYRQ